MLWPEPSKARSILNLGSLPLPWLSNGPLTLTVMGPLTPWVFFASILKDRFSSPELIFLSLLENVSLSRVFTSVEELAELLPPHAATPSDRAATRASRTACSERGTRRRA